MCPYSRYPDCISWYDCGVLGSGIFGTEREKGQICSVKRRHPGTQVLGPVEIDSEINGEMHFVFARFSGCRILHQGNGCFAREGIERC